MEAPPFYVLLLGELEALIPHLQFTGGLLAAARDGRPEGPIVITMNKLSRVLYSAAK